MSKHTEGKWVAHIFPSTNTVFIQTEDGKKFICEFEDNRADGLIDDVNRIVHCVNMHDEMLEALKEAADAISDASGRLIHVHKLLANDLRSDVRSLREVISKAEDISNAKTN